MNKFQVTLVQTKAIVIEMNTKTSDIATHEAKIAAEKMHLFDKRISTILVADVKKVEDE